MGCRVCQMIIQKKNHSILNSLQIDMQYQYVLGQPKTQQWVTSVKNTLFTYYLLFIFHFLGVSASDVCLHGLNLIMPLMSAELLKFPSLSLQYFKTITLVCELYPDKICNLNPELQKNLIASLELGKILFLYELV